VEDEPGDVKLLSDILSRVAPSISLEVFRDGLNAYDFFRRYNPDTRDHVALVLLDLNVPRLSGSELVNEIRKKLPLRHIPIVVLTGSDDQEQIRQAYELGANSYVSKHDDPERSNNTIRDMLSYWLNINRLPV
jgi:CheY-like chemotaxis protein